MKPVFAMSIVAIMYIDRRGKLSKATSDVGWVASKVVRNDLSGGRSATVIYVLVWRSGDGQLPIADPPMIDGDPLLE